MRTIPLALFFLHGVNHLLGNEDVIYNTPSLNKAGLEGTNNRRENATETIGNDFGQDFVGDRT